MLNRYTLFLAAFALILTGAGCSTVDVSFGDEGDTAVEEGTTAEDDTSVMADDFDAEDYEVPDGLVAVVDAPTRVAVGEQFDVTVTITNSTGEDQFLHSIDVSEEYLDGSVVLSVDPTFTDSFPLDDGTVTHFLEADVLAGEELVVTFSMEALKTGDFGGAFDVCFVEGFTCSYLQIRTIVE